MADGVTQNYPSGGSRVLTRQLRQAQGWHIGLKPGLQAASRRLYFSTYAFCLLFSAFCCAEELPDPTRPPASIAAPVVASGVAAASASVPAPAELQSVIISKTRRAAIIGGETVELGGKHGDAKLIEVNEGSVVLRSAQGRQVLTLFPDVKMDVVNTGKTTGKREAGRKPQPPAGAAQSGKQNSKPVVREEMK